MEQTRGQKREGPETEAPEAKKARIPFGEITGQRHEADAACVNTIRCLAPAVVSKANSGHPGAPMGCALMAHALFGYAMNYLPEENPRKFWGRDRFVLSNGHASALQYVMHYLANIGGMTEEALKAFRQWGSITPGHPENIITPGVEVTTGPLGQGIAQAVGLAVAATQLRARFGADLFDSYVYTILGDGCMQEGVAMEACSLAGHWGLSRLIALYDDNKITIDGDTKISFTEDIPARFAAWNWNVVRLGDGDGDLGALLDAIDAAKKVTDKPTLIVVPTTIGYGSSKQGTAKVHGAPLSAEDIAQLRTKCGFSAEPADFFTVADAAKTFYEQKIASNRTHYAEWVAKRDAFAKDHPEDFAELQRRFEGVGAAEHDATVLTALNAAVNFEVADAPRSISQTILKVIAPLMPELVGGSADLMESNKTAVVSELGGAFHGTTNPTGRYLHFGVREHAMVAICNGLAAYGGFKPFNATFLNFYTYAWGAVRLSALSKFPVLNIATHDSIELGEDGPTHQPIETLALFRATPNFHCYRPADMREAIGAYSQWLSSVGQTPVTLALARGKTPAIPGTSIAGVAQGAYVVQDFTEQADKENLQPGTAAASDKFLILAASGSELQIACAAAELCRNQGWNTRVVSIVSWDRFREQTPEYRSSVLPQVIGTTPVRRALIEPYSSYGIGDLFDAEFSTTVDTFGHSAPAKVIYENLGFTPEAIATKCTAAAQLKTKQ